MTLSVAGALEKLSDLSAISSGSQRIASAVRAVRFSTGLRRGWKEARVEASVHWVCRATGADPMQVRQQVADTGEPESWELAGLWRAHTDVVGAMGDLNDRWASPRRHSPRTMLARIRRDLVSAHPDVNERHRAGILALDEGRAQDMILDVADWPGPGLLVVAVILGQWLARPLNVTGDAWARDAFLRWYLTDSGMEPTGIAVPDLASAGQHLDVYTAGTRSGMNDWIEAVTDIIVESMTGAHQLSRSILAGRTDPYLGH